MDWETNIESILALGDRINEHERTIIQFERARDWDFGGLPKDLYNSLFCHHWFESFWVILTRNGRIGMICAEPLRVRSIWRRLEGETGRVASWMSCCATCFADRHTTGPPLGQDLSIPSSPDSHRGGGNSVEQNGDVFGTKQQEEVCGCL